MYIPTLIYTSLYLSLCFGDSHGDCKKKLSTLQHTWAREKKIKSAKKKQLKNESHFIHILCLCKYYLNYVCCALWFDKPIITQFYSHLKSNVILFYLMLLAVFICIYMRKVLMRGEFAHLKNRLSSVWKSSFNCVWCFHYKSCERYSVCVNVKSVTPYIRKSIWLRSYFQCAVISN